jgi:hypothetical protein
MLSGFAVGARRRPATGACRTALRADCGQAHVAGLAECINCVQAHDANLTAANCSTVQKESFCANAPGPLPPPPPPPPGPPVPPPPPPPPSPTPAPTPPAPPIPPGHIPEAVDWRKHGAVTPVKDQGQCGGCWAFAAVASLEGHYQLATGALRSLSEEQLLRRLRQPWLLRWQPGARVPVHRVEWRDRQRARLSLLARLQRRRGMLACRHQPHCRDT